MAISNSIRPLAFGLGACLIAFASAAQETPAAKVVTSVATASESIPSVPTFAIMAPPNAPKVTCDRGQLTIIADNSSLSGVLAAVRSCIGVKVEIPEGASGHRVFENLGPGPARDVLESLLNGTDMNFVIGSSEADPQKVDSILLLLRPADSSASTAPVASDRAMTPGRSAWLQRRELSKPPAPPGSDNNQPAVEPSDNPVAEDTVPTPEEGAKPAVSQAPAVDTASPAASTASPAPEIPAVPIAGNTSTTVPVDTSSSSGQAAGDGSKSTAEKIADMQQMFEQRRLITQAQNQTQTPASTQNPSQTPSPTQP